MWAAYLVASVAVWLICARRAFRVLARKDWLASVHLKGNRYPLQSDCPYYQRNWHNATAPCRHCATERTVNHHDTRVRQALLALGTGPLLLAALGAYWTVTAGQPLSQAEREDRLIAREKSLKQAEDDLREATRRMAGSD
jgi:hypothetical protein